MQACRSLLSEAGEFDEHLNMKGAPMAAVAALTKNFLRETEKV
jgi:hypothetical protein